MSAALAALLTLAGVLLVLATLRDVFQTLFHPSGKGVLSHAVSHAVWRVVRALAGRRPRLLQLGGPLGFLAVVSAWVLALTVGWALVYWPRLPEGFLFDGLDPRTNSGFLDALYLSLVSFATLGYGDITPNVWWLRLVAPLQALTGFGLLTAAITWLLSIYPALSNRRALADEVRLLRRAEEREDGLLAHLDADTAQQVLGELTGQLVVVRGDLIKFPISYYFHGRDEQAELSSELPYLLRLAERASAPDRSPGVRLRAVKLRGALDEFAARSAPGS